MSNKKTPEVVYTVMEFGFDYDDCHYHQGEFGVPQVAYRTPEAAQYQANILTALKMRGLDLCEYSSDGDLTNITNDLPKLKAWCKKNKVSFDLPIIPQDLKENKLLELLEIIHLRFYEVVAVPYGKEDLPEPEITGTNRFTKLGE